METCFSGNLALICPDCANHLVNVAPDGERYCCTDCELRLVREGDWFRLIRDHELIGLLAVSQVQLQVTWRPAELASAV